MLAAAVQAGGRFLSPASTGKRDHNGTFWIQRDRVVIDLEGVLITGGLGYVGGRLAQHLAQSSLKQISLGTRQLCQSPDWLASAAVVETRWHSNTALKDMCRGMDAIVHLAGMNAQDCVADPPAALEVNGLTTARLLQAAVDSSVKRFIYVSTAHVYGSPLHGSITEESCVTSLHPYASSHRAGEDAVLFAQEQRAIQGIVIRLSNSFGPPAHAHVNCWTLLVNDLCRQAVTTKRMTLRTSGIQRRDFVTLTDTCRAIACFLELDDKLLGNGLYNVGGAWSPTVIEMTERIGQCCYQTFGYRPEIIRPQPAFGENPVGLEYHIDKLLSTGFKLVGDVNSEIIETLNFCAAATGTKRQDG